MCLKKIKQGLISVLQVLTLNGLPTLALAAPQMPWDDSLLVLQQALTGTTAHLLIIIAIAISGLMWAVGDQGSMVQKAGKVILGGSIATGAVSICSALKLVGGY